jgi:hypothetical protein
MTTRVSSPPVVLAHADSSATGGYQLAGRKRLAGIVRRGNQVPKLGEAALSGLAGDIVQALVPTTEATAAAMLGTLLTTFGTMVGRGAHVLVGPQQHFPGMFMVVVGGTARDRKGTSAAAVQPVLNAADGEGSPFMRSRAIRGIQSGEALIQAAADAGSSAHGDSANSSPSSVPEDQRLLVLESEYGRLLTVAGRKNAILSEVLRSAWDGEPLVNRTRQQSLAAEHAHVGILGHITRDELRVKLAAVDVANGFANRFLYLLSRRTSLHPEPGRLSEPQVKAFGLRLHKAVAFAQQVGEVPRTPAFSQAWDDVYRVIESQPDGGPMFGNLSARATAHLIRLALVYALLDRSAQLEERHLHSALAVWEYSEATLAHVWGVTLGDRRLDRLAAAVAEAGSAGLPRTEVSRLFSNNLTKEDVAGLIARLVELGLATDQRQPTRGAPRQVLVSTI